MNDFDPCRKSFFKNIKICFFEEQLETTTDETTSDKQLDHAG